MSDQLRILETVTGDILERMTFLFSDRTAPDELPLPKEGIQVSIRFQGPSRGMLQAVTSAELCRQLTRNALGLDEGDPLTMPFEDAFKELLNVVTGEFLEKVFGKVAVYQLSIPESVPLADGEWETLVNDPRTVGFLIEEHPFVIHATTE